jgi:hypothetical protein
MSPFLFGCFFGTIMRGRFVLPGSIRPASICEGRVFQARDWNGMTRTQQKIVLSWVFIGLAVVITVATRLAVMGSFPLIMASLLRRDMPRGRPVWWHQLIVLGVVVWLILAMLYIHGPVETASWIGLLVFGVVCSGIWIVNDVRMYRAESRVDGAKGRA